MKVLAISGSPTKSGNTETLIKSLLEGAESKGAETKLIRLSEKKINGCRACMYCRSHEGCAIKDDMQDIYDEIDSADRIIIGSPVYMYKETAQTKTFIDRLFPFLNIPEYTSKIDKSGILVFTQGNPDTKEFRSNMESTAKSLDLLGIRIDNLIVRGTLNDPQAMAKDPAALSEVKHIGSQMI